MVDLKELQIKSKKFSVLYVEDDSALRTNTTELLEAFFKTVDTAENGQEGLKKYKANSYDLVISDIHMPIMNGIQFVDEIRKTDKKQLIIIISAHDESVYMLKLINLGVDYFLIKPIDKDLFFEILEKSVERLHNAKLNMDYQNVLEKTVRERTKEILEANRVIKKLNADIVIRLTSAAEFRDNETGEHILRQGIYAARLAEELGLSFKDVELISMAAPLHDIGKIGISDTILLKEGPLTTEEYEIMKSHSSIGSRILADSDLENIETMRLVALTHHERWDGSGYPQGLKGEEIPLVGRIVNICDQYDALRSKRPYKDGFSHEKTMDILLNGDGRTEPKHFDPRILSAFKNVASDFNIIFEENSKSEN